MRNSLQTIIRSIISSDNHEFSIGKLNRVVDSVILTEVESKIIKEILDNLYAGTMLNYAYLSAKYPYFFTPEESILFEALEKDAIEPAIATYKLAQDKLILAKSISELASETSGLNAKELKERISTLLTNPLLESKDAIVTTSLVEKEDAYSELADKEGMDWTLPGVEKYAGKITPGTVVSILGFVGSFKSTAAAQIALMNALKGYNVLYLALEDTESKIKSRLILNHMAHTVKDKQQLIESTWLRDRKLADSHIKVYNKMHNELIKKLDNHLILWDQTSFDYHTMAEMEQSLRKADKQFKKNTGSGIYAVVIDQISLLKYTNGSGKKQSYDGAVINEWVSFFYKQCLNFLDEARQIAVVMVSQVGREKFAEASKPKKKGRYEADCASDASEIERASTTMVTLYKDMDMHNTLLINIPKAREGYQPDNPLQVEVHGEYFYVGQLAAENQSYVSEDIFKANNTNDFSLASLIDMTVHK